VPVIGVLIAAAPPKSGFERIGTAVRQGIGEQGYVEGRNVEVLYRIAEGQFERLPELAADLVRRGVAVIFAFDTPSALAAKKATATIPIVFFVGTDPVQVGLVASLNRPGGNVTGTTHLLVELAAKRIELLHEIVPAAKSIGYLYDPANPALEEPSITALETAARTLGLRLITAKVITVDEIERAFAMLVGEGIGAVLIGGILAWTNQIIALAAHYALPAMYPYGEQVHAGGLISYAGDIAYTVRRAGTYVGRILKGEKPADLPVEETTHIEMIVNLKTAKALGLTVPQSILLRADEVIE
jgi:putative ABC transport system substrate-binding protein